MPTSHGKGSCKGQNHGLTAEPNACGLAYGLGETEINFNTVTDTGSSNPQAVAGKVRIPCGRLYLRMAQQFAGHRKPFSQCQRPGRKGVTRVMDADVVKSRTGADSPPRVLQIGKMRSPLASDDHPRIVALARKGCEQASR